MFIEVVSRDQGARSKIPGLRIRARELDGLLKGARVGEPGRARRTQRARGARRAPNGLAGSTGSLAIKNELRQFGHHSIVYEKKKLIGEPAPKPRGIGSGHANPTGS